MLKTADSVSPGINGVDVLISLISFTAIYGILAVVELKLYLKAAQTGPVLEVAEKTDSEQLTFAY
jgi:cytochrome d ubiquinol oxidase subunit I